MHHNYARCRIASIDRPVLTLVIRGRDADAVEATFSFSICNFSLNLSLSLLHHPHISLQSRPHHHGMDPFMTPPAASASALEVTFGGESNNHPRKTRSACNRCHSQKLRCAKQIGQSSCERCLKLRRSCRFGPRAPRVSLQLPKQDTNCTQGDWHEPLSVSASMTRPSVPSNTPIADVSNSDSLFSLNAETAIAEGRG